MIVGGKPAHYPRRQLLPGVARRCRRRATVGAGATADRSWDVVRRQATDGRDPAREGRAARERRSAAARDDGPRGRRRNQADAGVMRCGIDAVAVATMPVVLGFAALLLAYIYVGYPIIAALRALVHAPPRAARADRTVGLDRRRGPQRSRADRARASRTCWRSTIRAIGSRSWSALTDRPTTPSTRAAPVRSSAGVTRASLCGAPRQAGGAQRHRPGAARRDRASSPTRGSGSTPGTLRALVANFADPAVGAVSGELVLTTSDGTAAAGRGSAFYWRYEKFIRSTERQRRFDDRRHRARSTRSAATLFEPIPDDTILDDVLIPLRIVAQGYRVVFEPRRARLRLGVGDARSRSSSARRGRLPARSSCSRGSCWLLNPRAQPALVRDDLAQGAAAGAAGAARGAARGERGARAQLDLVLSGGVGCTGGASTAAAIVGYTPGRNPRHSFLVTVPCAICLLSWATVVGFARFLTNRQQVTWERVAAPGVSSTKAA